MSLTKSQKTYLKEFMEHGSGDAKVSIDPEELGLLINLSYHDLYGEFIVNEPHETSLIRKGYYNISDQEFENLPAQSIEECWNTLVSAGANNPSNDIYLYLKNISDLHRRRRKFTRILRNQPFPKVDQIGPRVLLEYGKVDKEILFTWMFWRKWIYDIDNRSAQETGYLFEPILARSMGGEPVSHRYSPVKRINADGNPTAEGRQIDCFIEDENLAFELKLRVTIAASGQGRFREELSFPTEAARAGLKPILVVFDPTESTLLTQLSKAYRDNGGEVYTGEAAWNLINEKAGTSMSTFINKYIKPPIQSMATEATEIPDTLELKIENDSIVLSTDSGIYNINRCSDRAY